MGEYAPAYAGIIRGQILLAVCCVFYLIWWSISFRPGETVNRVGGVRGLLLLVTALCGIAGVLLNAHGNSMVPRDLEPLNGGWVIAAGVLAYVVLLLVTTKGMKRPVTTELFLITAWTVLEVSTMNALCGAGSLTGGRLLFMGAVTAAAFIISMVIYVLYYRMEAWHAFYAAMVPLATECLAMLLLVLLSRRP